MAIRLATVCFVFAHACAVQAQNHQYEDPWTAAGVIDRGDVTLIQSDSDTSERHERLWNSIKGSNDQELLQLFIGGFPDSPFAEEAKATLASLKNAETQNATSEDAVAAETTQTTSDIRFSAKMQTGAPQIIGKTINQVLLSSPAYPPVEELPEEMWKERLCAHCHDWTRTRICTQAGTYLDRTDDDVASKNHPFGGSFKVNLKYWAQDGCK